MIKFKADVGGGEPILLGFGLNRQELARLVAGGTLRADGARFGMPGYLVEIYAGESDMSMYRQLRDAGCIRDGADLDGVPLDERPVRAER